MEVKRLKTRTFTLFKSDIQRMTNIAESIANGHAEEHGGSYWAALYCFGITFESDVKRFLEFLEATERFALLKAYQQETLF